MFLRIKNELISTDSIRRVSYQTIPIYAIHIYGWPDNVSVSDSLTFSIEFDNADAAEQAMRKIEKGLAVQQ